MGFDGETLIIVVFIFFAIMSFSSGSNWSTDNPLIWGPALFTSIPFAIFGSIASSAPILVPLALIALLAYFDFLTVTLGEPFVMLIIFGAVIVMIGV